MGVGKMNIKDHIKKRFENETPLPIRTTISKTKLLEWVRQQQKECKKYLDDSHIREVRFLHSSQIDCWNKLAGAIEAGGFDD
jgi:hypothetical protein